MRDPWAEVLSALGGGVLVWLLNYLQGRRERREAKRILDEKVLADRDDANWSRAQREIARLDERIATLERQVEKLEQRAEAAENRADQAESALALAEKALVAAEAETERLTILSVKQAERIQELEADRNTWKGEAERLLAERDGAE